MTRGKVCASGEFQAIDVAAGDAAYIVTQIDPPELTAMAVAELALDLLDADERDRALLWLVARFAPTEVSK